MPESDDLAGENSAGQGGRTAFAQAPQITLPKGGGAIRGIGEKFSVNPVTGTASFTVPVATSPGRSGFGPQLALSYDSGSGNGPFGFGWSLSIPAITRKTDKGLPQYDDAAESDVFVLSGAEDLVPVVNSAGTRFSIETPDGEFLIHRYRPRIEGLFVRLERWTRRSDGDVHWRSISRDNILTLYGKDETSRVADPTEPRRVFSWLICESRDDKGNAILYSYKAENGAGVDLALPHQRNRGAHGATERTANRYLERIHYGNRASFLDAEGRRPRFASEAQIEAATWMFEIVFDYGEYDADVPVPTHPGAWTYRPDPFSSYRAGFEVRTCRLCRRILMFHHFEQESDVGDNCLVRSTDLTYTPAHDPADASHPVHTFLRKITHCGYRRQGETYLRRGLPPLEFEYTQPVVQGTVEDVDAASLEHLPIGVDGAAFRWTDLHGEGIPGVLAEQAGAWFYKRNLSPLGGNAVALAPAERVLSKPNAVLAGAQAEFMDLAGDGQPDLVLLDPPVPGLYEHDGDEGWQPFRAFTSRLGRDMRDPNLKFIDLSGDGHSDVLISESDGFVWHPSLAEAGFGPARRVRQAMDEELGPHLVFADGTQAIFLADMSGDGLTDLVRIRNGEVCYWPNLGYGRFGARITMDHSPFFDHPDRFDHNRLRLADIDGSGATDVIYLGADEVRLYFNQSGNGWSAPQQLPGFPHVDNLAAISTTDLLGAGTTSLVWSTPLPGNGRRQMRYVDLMGRKPHLLVKIVNNLGAETTLSYAPSTRFYLQDRQQGHAWLTRLAFPVHVVERVETHDQISGNRFVTRYAYHHGYFDGEEREFRGFGRVDQLDTEEFASLTADGTLPATNLDAATHVPPVLTKTWFHTGAFLGNGSISRRYDGEYYTDEQGERRFLEDTNLPPDLTPDEERQACRALKGLMLRQEIFARDGAESGRAGHPYTVVEQSFAVRMLQPIGQHRHAVFFTHPREAITHHYERTHAPADPRISHALTLDVDDYGNVLRSLTVAYPREVDEGRAEQQQTHMTLSLNRVVNRDAEPDWRRIGLPVETRAYEVVRPPTKTETRFSWEELRSLFAVFVPADQHAPDATVTVPYQEWEWRTGWNPGADPGGFHDADGDGTTDSDGDGLADEVPHTRLRPIEHLRTLYRSDDLTAFLPLGEVESRALPGESYQLALTVDLLESIFKRRKPDGSEEHLLSDPLTAPDPLFDGKQGDEGGYEVIDGSWWIPSGRVFFAPEADLDDPALTAAAEFVTAREHFFLPRKYTDPFDQSAMVTYDAPAAELPYDLFVTSTRDAVGNTATAVHDYRVLQPQLLTDPNGNQTAALFDVLGLVAATAVMGRPTEGVGDVPEGIDADLELPTLQAFMVNPAGEAPTLLGKATTRILYDLDRYLRTGQPPFAATLARETHLHDLAEGETTEIQVSFAYSDGFGREIQKKIQAEAGDAPLREPNVLLDSGDIAPGELKRDGEGGLIWGDTLLRWVGSGRTVFNNKGKPVKQYEPFFSATHLYEPERDLTDTGFSPVLFYDPVERVIATLHPNHTFEKVVFSPWRQQTYDVNDTVAADAAPTGDAQTGDPRTDPDIAGYMRAFFAEQPATWQT
jgi:hypothetical protein